MCRICRKPGEMKINSYFYRNIKHEKPKHRLKACIKNDLREELLKIWDGNNWLRTGTADMNGYTKTF
jgi:hypothetical protein